MIYRLGRRETDEKRRLGRSRLMSVVNILVDVVRLGVGKGKVSWLASLL